MMPPEPRLPPDSHILRVLDAAANRGREGLRVLEDYARFVLNSPRLMESLKTIRHRLAELMQPIPLRQLLDSRDTTGDVGCDIHTSQERTRDSNESLLIANCKRVQESLRTLEEFGKRISPEAAAAMGQLRYETYTLEKSLYAVEWSCQKLAGQSLCWLATSDLCPQGWEQTVRDVLSAGCRMIQMREKSASGRELIERGLQLRTWTRDVGALLIVNDRPDIALAIDADGVHVGQDDLPIEQVRHIIGPDRLIGLSTHTIQQARDAVQRGADYLGVGPVFTTTTKQFDQLAGVEFAVQVASEIELPWFAIGGISEQNVPELTSCGVSRVAVSSAIASSASPREAACRLLELLDSSGTSISNS